MKRTQSIIPTVAALVYASCASAATSNPNIVVIYADDMGYGDVSGLNEDSKIPTPNIDRLIASGVTFTDAHSCSSVSTPSRYGLLTGRYNWRSPLKENVIYGYDKALIPSTRTTIASMLKQQGYNTACIGKWHLGWSWNNIENGVREVRFDMPISEGPTTVGFDYFYGIAGSLDMPPYVYVENDMPTAVPDTMTRGTGMQFWRQGPTAPDFKHKLTLPHFVDKAVEYIGSYASSNAPYFLYLPLPAPHTPIVPTQEYKGATGLNDYGDFVVMVDAMVGRVTDAIEQSGEVDNTIIVFSSDNGCSPEARFDELAEKGHHPSYIYRGYKADLYEGGHRIPCIVSWSDRIEPHTVSQTVSLTDFMATFAGVTNYTLKDNEGEDSYNLLPVMVDATNQTIIRPATVFHSIDGFFSIRQGDWKLLVCSWSGGWSYPTLKDLEQGDFSEYQLYNIADDPSEEHNVWAENRDKAAELKALLDKYIADGRSAP